MVKVKNRSEKFLVLLFILLGLYFLVVFIELTFHYLSDFIIELFLETVDLTNLLGY
jgi:hypothetical protein